MTGVLITGARAPVALDLARVLAARGNRVVVADSTRSITASSRAVSAAYRIPAARYDPLGFRDAVTGIAARHGLDLVVPTCEEVFWLAGTMTSRDGGGPALLAPPLDVLRRLHDKAAFSVLCRRIGVSHPATEVIRSAHQWRDARSRRRGDARAGLVAKPAFSRFAAETILLREGDPLPEPPRLTRDRPWLLQERVDGDEVCVSAVASSGRLTAAVVYRPGWRAGRGAAVALVRVPDGDPIAVGALDVARRIVAETGYTGLIGFDLLATDRDVVVLECNPRATSGLHLFSSASGLASRILEAGVRATSIPAEARSDTGASPGPRRIDLVRADRDEVRLAVPHALFAVPGMVAGGSPRRWVRGLAAPDVLRVPGDRIRRGALAGAFGAQVLAAARTRRPLLAASTHDIEWNGDPLPGDVAPSAWQTAATRALVAVDPVSVAENLPVTMESVTIGEHELPVTVTRHDDPRRDRSYVVSPMAHYVDYSREELRRLPSAMARRMLAPVVDAIGVLLDRARADDLVVIGNHLVSTNLHAPWAASDLARAVDELVRRHPSSAIAVRSVHARLGRLPDLLRSEGWTLVPSRSILLVPTADDDWLRRRDVRRDRALAARSEYVVERLAPGSELSPGLAERLVELYSMLYLEKHSRLNPRYTADFVRLAVRTGLLELSVLRRGDRIDGVVGTYAAHGWLAAPFLGYDTSLPAELGLYRMLSLTLADDAHDRGLDLHASSGVAAFKRSRGAEPELEWTAVYTRHLPLARRAAWTALATLLDTAAVPLLTRYAL
ncbi:GNAT family N-acetyltransferase [Cnuibacter physcomitrellae]|uniref:GNAT family N-acetyltransferase n=1 Tax=Cnuibacter physcomitrellae TaxID=1619308 RepID=UPI0021759366|nr:GNAT family N-acetyltransferase [Cnuibacter physcomitrellae]MCS5496648.1 GNAT family N-acetyltransferase [Cnuibacter physcomitrellae]